MECKSSTRARRFVSIAGCGFCFHARTCGRAGWLLGAFVWPPIKLSYLLIIAEIRTRPLTTYGNTRTNVRGTWSSLTDYVPCTPASNLMLSHVISFQISLSRNFEAQYRSVNQFSLKFIYFFICWLNMSLLFILVTHNDVISAGMSSAHLGQVFQGYGTQQ